MTMLAVVIHVRHMLGDKIDYLRCEPASSVSDLAPEDIVVLAG